MNALKLIVLVVNALWFGASSRFVVDGTLSARKLLVALGLGLASGFAR